MDPLSDVLALLKPRSYITAGFDAGGEWAVRFDDQGGRIKCYAVRQGGCWLAVEGVSDPVRLTGGDCFVLPSGRTFRLCSHLHVEPLPAREVFAPARPGGIVTHNGGGDLFLFGSRFDVNGLHAEVLLRTLPPILHLEVSEDQAALRWSIARMTEEVSENKPGGSLIAHHLAHMMLVHALRIYLAERPGAGVGWFFALSDPQIGAALAAMHANPSHRWTLAALAAEACMSRSVFAQRFREKVGETPIGYLTRWRMMLASDRLTQGDDPLVQTALSLGYQSENAFNTAFKRVIGCSPRRYGRTDAAPGKLKQGVERGAS